MNKISGGIYITKNPDSLFSKKKNIQKFERPLTSNEENYGLSYSSWSFSIDAAQWHHVIWVKFKDQIDLYVRCVYALQI